MCRSESGNAGNARVRFPQEKARTPRAYIATSRIKRDSRSFNSMNEQNTREKSDDRVTGN